MAVKTIIISRQYGSGGREIGKHVAEKLGFAYYDKDLIKMAAQEGSFDEEIVQKSSEGILGRFSTLLNYTNSIFAKDESGLPMTDRLFLVQSRIIKKLADEGPCVIIGHSADYFLQDYPNLLNVYIHSDLDSRIARVMSRNNLSKQEAISRIKKTDRQRSVFYEQHTEQKWGMASNYDLCLSSSYFGIDGAVDAIIRVSKLELD